MICSLRDLFQKIRAKKTVIDGVTYLDGSLMCDIDMDVCYYRRKEVLRYLDEEFEGKTAKIRTLNTLSGKLVIKECGKTVEDKSETEMNHISFNSQSVWKGDGHI